MISERNLAQTLRHEILTGALPPGSELLQTALAARFGLSRIPVRDALQRLAADRLVTVIPGKGARVIALNRAELSEVYELRLLLEAEMAHHGAVAANAADHAEALHQLRKSDLEAGRPGWREGDWAFHAALYAPARRPRHMALIAELRETCAIHTLHYDTLIPHTPQWLADHQAIFDAWAEGKASLASALTMQHITQARDHLLMQMP